MYRYFLEGSYAEGAVHALEAEEARHLFVLRQAIGERVECVNGQGDLAVGELVALDARRREASVRLLEITHTSPPSYEKWLVQALPRLEHLELIVEKGTELGMNRLILFPGEKSERSHLTVTQRQRLLRIARSALKQSGNLYLPVIEERPPLREWKEPLPYPSFFGDLEAEVGSWSRPEGGAACFIGPESGFSEREVACLKALKVQGIRLHRHTLRAETAAIVFLALFD